MLLTMARTCFHLHAKGPSVLGVYLLQMRCSECIPWPTRMSYMLQGPGASGGQGCWAALCTVLAATGLWTLYRLYLVVAYQDYLIEVLRKC